MNKPWVYFIIGIIAIVALNSMFVVEQWNQAIIFQFGEAIKSIQEPGLKFKIPLIQSTTHFDKRILNYNLEEKEILAQDEKRLIVSAYIKYRITDPVRFYQTVGTQDKAPSRLYSILDSSLRQVIGQVPFNSLLGHQRSDIMKRIEETISSKSDRFGVSVVDVRILRADLPKENSEAIYRRMQSEREKEAREFRAQGAQEAEKIKSEADRDRKIIIADAYKISEILRGEGDAIAAKLYAEAYSKDAEFYEFYKSLDSYKKSFSKENTKIILSPANEFMRIFNNK